MFIGVDANGYVFKIINDAKFLTEGEIPNVIEVPSIPNSEVQVSKIPILKYSSQKGLYYEYVDRPKTQEEILSETVSQLSLENADLKTQVQTLSQTVASLSVQ